MKTARTFCIEFLLTVALSTAVSAQGSGMRAPLAFHDAGLRGVLDSLMRIYGVSIVYLDSDIADAKGSVSCADCTLQQALDAVLSRTRLTWIITGNQVILRERTDAGSLARGSIAGFVTDSSDGSALQGATIRLLKIDQGGRPELSGWCPTNASGFFSLARVPSGSYRLEAHVVGYRAMEMTLQIADGRSLRCDLKMEQEEIRMQEVTIEGQRSELTSSGGVTRGVYFPSSPDDQNTYFLDGARVYNPSHFGGVLSTFNADALNDVQEFSDGPPPYYGGGIGAILDVSVRDGLHDRFSGSAGTNSLGAHMTLEGPLTSTLSVVASGRRGFPDAAVPFLRDYGSPSRQGSSEAMIKLTDIISSGSRLSFGGYIGEDAYSNQVDGYGSRLNNIFSWGNALLDLRWLAVVSSSTFIQASAAYSRYDLDLDQEMSGAGAIGLSGMPLSSTFGIEDINLRAYAEHYYDMEHTFRAGVELTRHAMRGTISPFSTQTAPYAIDQSPFWEVAVHLEDQWRLLPDVAVEIGARATSFTGGQGSVSAVDPRFSLRYSPGEATQIYASLSAVNEFLHPYRNSGVYLLYPTVFWYPSGNSVKPSTSLQLRLGAETALWESGLSASAGGFYRVVENLQEFGPDTTATHSATLEDEIVYGTGKSYGCELALRKRSGDLTGSISYMLSWGSNRVPALNGGNPFPPHFDRRHEVQVSASYSPGNGWDVGLLAVLAIESVNILSVPAPPVGVSVNGRGMTASAAPGWLFDVNGDKYPGFQRLEIQVSRAFTMAELPCSATLRLVNAYGLIDPFEWQLQNTGDLRSKWKATLQDLKLFPLFPTFGLSVRF